ncbi:GyrI-like domain-containing protein [Flavobacteriaceae bacterium]|nr:GyrI-like domain-containing protein [Flavobacteriaceae bacterium]
MFEQILELNSLSLRGYSTRMSLVDNKTPSLWKEFMQSYHKKLENHPKEFYSLEIYDSLDYFREFNPNESFEKYAMVESNRLESTNDEKLKSLTIKGKYAVFLHKGAASKIGETYEFIMSKWLINSGQNLDNRPFFSIMDEGYLGENPKSQERIYIPIQ